MRAVVIGRFGAVVVSVSRDAVGSDAGRQRRCRIADADGQNARDGLFHCCYHGEQRPVTDAMRTVRALALLG